MQVPRMKALRQRQPLYNTVERHVPNLLTK